MRLAHLADLHVTEGPRLDDQRGTLERVTAAVLESRPDLVIIAGDLYGHTVPHRSTPAERAVLYPALAQLAQAAPVVVVRGNHDHELDVQGLEHLASDWPVTVVTRAQAIELSTPAGVVHLYGLPYPTKRWILAGESVPSGVEQAQRMVQAKLDLLLRLWAGRIQRMRAERPTEPHVFAGHLQIRGSTAGAGVVLAGQEIELTIAQLEGLPVDYGALGHLHERQETAPRYWYSGSLWNTAHSTARQATRCWHLVDVGDGPAFAGQGYQRDDDAADEWSRYSGGMRQPIAVGAVPSNPRPFVTLDYRWGERDGRIGWLRQPHTLTGPDNDIRDAEVRARLTVPAQHVASCPWQAELDRLEQLGAHRVVAERSIEPTLRTRAPQVAAAVSVADKLAAYWSTLATTPTDAEQGAALACLRELQTDDDDQINQTTDALL